MRPSMGGNALPIQSSKQSFDERDVTTPMPVPGNAVPTTFFMASESMLERSDSTAALSGSKSNFGVRSLEETLDEEEAGHHGEEHESIHDKLNARRRSTIKARLYGLRDRSSDSLGQLSTTSKTGSSPPPRPRQPRQASDDPSQPLTPISYASPIPGSSLPSSPKSTSTRSFRPSDEDSADDARSQAIASSGDEDAEASPTAQTGSVQLIMPSIMMPSRRPFTERGRDLGKLKVLLAGASGMDLGNPGLQILTSYQALGKRLSLGQLCRRAKTLSTSTRYHPIHPPSIAHPCEKGKANRIVCIPILPKASLKSMRVQKHIHHGGRISRTARFYEGGRVLEKLYWRGTCVLLIPLDLMLTLLSWKLRSLFISISNIRFQNLRISRRLPMVICSVCLQEMVVHRWILCSISLIKVIQLVSNT